MNTDEPQIKTAEKLDWLIEQWCERREPHPLKYLLPIYPGTLVHADQISQLLESLRDIKGLGREKLTAEELSCVIAANKETEDAF